MVAIKFIVPTAKFKEDMKVRDKGLKEKLQKQIDKIAENPNFGKPLRYDLRGEWSIHVRLHRLICKLEGDKLILLRFEHRKEVDK